MLGVGFLLTLLGIIIGLHVAYSLADMLNVVNLFWEYVVSVTVIAIGGVLMKE